MKEIISLNPFQLDEIDLQILKLLGENAKIGTKEIGSKIGLTVTPTFERIRRMEKRGVIKGYTVRVDPAAIGKELMVFCQVSLKTHNTELLDVFETHVKEFPEVSSVYHVAGNYDYLVQVQVSGMAEYQSFLKEKLASIPNIANVQSTFVFSSLKKN